MKIFKIAAGHFMERLFAGGRRRREIRIRVREKNKKKRQNECNILNEMKIEKRTERKGRSMKPRFSEMLVIFLVFLCILMYVFSCMYFYVFFCILILKYSFVENPYATHMLLES